MLGAFPLGFQPAGFINFIPLILIGGVGVFGSGSSGAEIGSTPTTSIFQIAAQGSSFGSKATGAIFASVKTGLITNNA